MLYTLMGTGCDKVTRAQTKDTELVTGVWKDGRIGTFRGLRGKSGYGALVFGAKGIAPGGGSGGYEPLLVEIGKFFRTGKPPVSLQETLEILTFMEAADESKRQGGAPVSLDSVLAKARAEAAARRSSAGNRPGYAVDDGLDTAPEESTAMLSIGAGGIRRLGGPLTRRELLRVGAIGLGGLTLPGLLRLQQAAAAPADRRVRATAGRARSVILLFLSGGPAHQDMWDLKPEAPEEIRGTFRPIATNVPGIDISEHMPRMARLADKYAIVRSVHHQQSNHPAAAYWMMIGSPIARPSNEAGAMSRADRPHPGSALAQVLGPDGEPPAVRDAPRGDAAQRPGTRGAARRVPRRGVRPLPDQQRPEPPRLFARRPGAARPSSRPLRLGDRRSLLEVLQAQGRLRDRGESPEDFDVQYGRAFDLIASSAAQRAFDLKAEPDSVRDRYGRHVFGQSVLLARRMVEAGVRLVQVNWVRHDNGKGGQGYDSHRDHLEWARTDLLPPTDAAFAALVEDLDERGLLDETLVIMMGEFGRTPQVQQRRRPRPLAAMLQRRDGRRRHPRRPGLRLLRQGRRLSRLRPRHSRRPDRHALPLPRRRPAEP